MMEQTKQLGKLESVHGISPVFLQRALVVIILSFIFFFVMLIAFSLRQQFGYFLLATAFLIVKIFTLFGWMMQRKKEIRLYENGFAYKKSVCLWSEIESVESTNKKSCTIIKTDKEKIILPDIMHNMAGIIEKIQAKIVRKGIE